MNSHKERIVCRVLTGPTASGKTALSLTAAERMGLEILCMDSMQVYRRMDIGTAKPTREERARVPHHLLDIVDPGDAFNVSDYCEAAGKMIRKIWKERHREVLFVGGTGLYLEAMMHPMPMGSIPEDPAFRAELQQIAREENGRRILHDRLAKCDPATAERLPLNDLQRVIRAIEVSELTGVPFSKQPRQAGESPFEWHVVSTAVNRTELYRRIEERCVNMIRAGLAEEVGMLLEEGVPENARSMQGLGYKEMIPYLHGEITLEEATKQIILGSRHYAKRQITFLKRISEITYVETDREDCAEQILRIFGKEEEK